MLTLFKARSTLIQSMWRAGAITCLVSIWKNRNGVIYNGKKSNIKQICFFIRRAVIRAYHLSRGCMANTVLDLEVLHGLRLNTKTRRAPQVFECYWAAPPIGVIKVNTDGSCRGNPGMGGWGASFRGNNGTFLGAYAGGIGVTTCYIAESHAIVEGINRALDMGWTHIWVESDSEAAIKAFKNNQVHWSVKGRWENVRRRAEWINLSRAWRETNLGADACARFGARLPKGVKQWWDQRPTFMNRLENQQSTYFRFVN